MDGVVDHIHPHALGGSNRRENLWLCCSDCNKRKQDMRLTVWAYTQGISPERLYVALKRDGKSIPQDLLDLLNLED
jgi:5-methylcytosine-specific restriction endonuclease McrA